MAQDQHSQSSAPTRRLAWILALAGGVVAVLVGFALGRGDRHSGSALASEGESQSATATSTATSAATSTAPADVPIVVELFTSQGCSSCPPADRLLAELARDQPVPGALIVPLSEHVDYWNRLGWTDPFSAVQFSDRQRTYAHAAGSRRIYTPQMMVDGRFGFVGSERKEALASIAKASMAPHADVALSACEDTSGSATDDPTICRHVEIRNIPTVTEGDTARVVYAVTESGLQVEVPSGENAGRELSHVAVVREMDDLGPIDGDGVFTGQVAVRVDPEWARENLRLVVFVQEEGSRRILGAGVANL